MAQLPESQQLNDVSAPGPAIAGVQPTDFGLDSAGQALETASRHWLRADSMQMRATAAADRKAAMPAFQQAAGEIQDDYATAAGQWNGATAGFAKDALQRAGAIAAKYRAVPGLGAGAQSELDNLLSAHVNQIGQQAISHEGAVLYERNAQITKNSQDLQVDQALNSANAGYQQGAHDLKLNWKAGDPPLADQIAKFYDTSFQPALDALPDYLKPQAQARLISGKQTAIADALSFQVNTGDAQMVQGVKAQADQIADTVQTTPTYFDQALKTDLPNVIAKLPRGLQEPVLREYQQKLVGARVEGLKQHQQAHQAYDELHSTMYDGILTPEQKAQLADGAASALRSQQPVTADQIVARAQALDAVDAEAKAQANGQSTGLDLGKYDGILNQGDLAQARLEIQAAQRVHAASGSVFDMSNADLAAEAVKPDPAASDDPNYPAELKIAQIRRTLAADELKRRQQDPAAAIFDVSRRGPPTKGVGATSQAYERATSLNQSWQQVNTTTGQAQVAAANSLATASLGLQAQQGVPEAQRKLVPQPFAADAVARYQQAPPDQKLAEGARLGALVNSLPGAIKLSDGTWTNPQQIFMGQLKAAGLSDNAASAFIDFGTDRAKLGRWLQAESDPRVNAKPGQQEKKDILTLTDKVTGQLKPFLDVAAPLPGSDSLYRARVARTVQIARSLMADHPGLSMDDAAKQASADLVSGYRYVDGWRMPEQLAGKVSFNASAPAFTSWLGMQDGAAQARLGAAKALSALVADKGAHIMAAPGELPAVTVQRITSSARWVTSPDDGGLMLMIPHAGGPYEQVRDKWGRPVTATWQQLSTYATGSGDPGFDKPPPSVHYNGQPVPAATRQQVMRALGAAIVEDGEHGRMGQVSPKGAAGKWQVTEDTVKTFAPQLGLPVDMERARTDEKYNTAIGQAALAAYVNRYATGGPGGYALATAAYNAGPTRVDRWIAQLGDPRSGRISVDDWIKRIPPQFRETHDYVGRVLPGAVRRLSQGQH